MKHILILLAVFIIFVIFLSYNHVRQKQMRTEPDSLRTTAEAVESLNQNDVQSETVEYDFRKTYWGMSRDEVLKSENCTPRSDDGKWIWCQPLTIANLPCLKGYLMAENKLVQARYFFTHEHINENQYISDYDNLKNMLIKKYGEPVKDNIIWLNDLYRNRQHFWGIAIAKGHLEFQSWWYMERSEISLILWGDNFDTRLAIDYYSVEFADLRRRAKESKALDDL